MSSPTSADRADAARGVTRRQIVQGTAWAAPAIVVASAAPAMAASAPCGPYYDVATSFTGPAGGIYTLHATVVDRSTKHPVQGVFVFFVAVSSAPSQYPQTAPVGGFNTSDASGTVSTTIDEQTLLSSYIGRGYDSFQAYSIQGTFTQDKFWSQAQGWKIAPFPG